MRDAAARRSMLAVTHTGLTSGAEAVLLRLLAAAVAQGWYVRCAAPDGPVVERLAALGVERVVIPELRLPRRSRSWGAFVLGARSARAAAVLRRAGATADVIVANGFLTLPALRLARPRAPIAWVVHDVIHRREWRALLRACASVVHTAIAVSESAAAPVRRQGVRTVVVPNGTAWPVEPATPAAAPPYVIGCSGLLVPWKGQTVLIDALARLSRNDVVLDVMGGHFPGDATYAAGLRHQAKRLGIEERILFPGHVADGPGRMRGWTVAVSASVEPEACPLSVLEAMSMGIPVVATAHGGPAEWVGEAGLLVPPHDAAAMSDAIQRLLADDDLRRVCSSAGRRIVADGFVAERQLNRLLEAIGEVINEAAPRGRARRRAVTLVVPDFFPATGGTTSLTDSLAEVLADDGFDVTVLTRRVDRSWPRREERGGVHVARVGPPGRRAFAEKMALVAITGFLLRRRSRQAAVQLVMYHDAAFSVALAGLRSRGGSTWAAMGQATTVLLPGHSVLRRIQGAARRWALNGLDHVVLTPAMAVELRDLGLAPAPAVIPQPVDPAFFRPPSPDERAAARAAMSISAASLVVIYTGHFRSLKRVDRLVAAFAGLKASGNDALLVLVGGSRGADDDVEADVRAQVASLGLESFVVFTGAVSGPAAVRSHLWAADIFVLPSEQEGMPTSMLEAMACRIACVAPASAGGDQLLYDEAGVIPPSGEPVEIEAALMMLAADGNLRLAIGARGRERVEAFTPRAVADAYEARWKSRAGNG